MRSQFEITMKAAATLIVAGSFASVHAVTVTWDNGGGSGDSEWGTAANWDPAAPGNDDDVIIGNGDTVNITGKILTSNLNIILSGGSDLTYTSVTGAAQFNMASASIAFGAGSDLSLNGTIRMSGSASMAFDDGATLGSALDLEFRGSSAGLQFNLGPTGFTTLTPGGLSFWNDPDEFCNLSNINFTVDFANYTSESATITLIDWDTDMKDANTTQALLDAATQNFNNAAGYENIVLTWDEDATAINLSFDTDDTVDIPEPSSVAALLGLVGAFAVILRRQRS